MNPSKSVIEINHLYAGYKNIPVIEDISFDVLEGEILVIIGGSGCGKSTLLKHMIGLLPPISGEVKILGEDLGNASDAERSLILRKIGVAFQSGALFGSMTVLENVQLPLKEFTSLPESAIEMVALGKLARVGLEHSALAMPSELSGGMKKRAALARAMALDPAIIFLDEPSAGLDPVTSADLDQLIKNLSASLGITFVIITHELASIEQIAQRVVMLDKSVKGMIATGTVEQLKQDHENRIVSNFFNRTANVLGEP